MTALIQRGLPSASEPSTTVWARADERFVEANNMDTVATLVRRYFPRRMSAPPAPSVCRLRSTEAGPDRSSDDWTGRFISPIQPDVFVASITGPVWLRLRTA